jgi:predicted enzyme related to lactoylglutathione lyase
MSFYIDVEDLKAYRKRIVDAGGKILVEEQQVPGMGAFSLFSDPDGRVLGIWKQDPSGN